MPGTAVVNLHLHRLSFNPVPLLWAGPLVVTILEMSKLNHGWLLTCLKMQGQ